MTAPDLELEAGLSAGELRTHVAHDAHVQATGRWVALIRSETRIGISEKVESGGCYCNVVVEKRLIARNQVPGSQRRRRSAYGLRDSSSTTSMGG
jgi:hypothetical protein